MIKNYAFMFGVLYFFNISGMQPQPNGNEATNTSGKPVSKFAQLQRKGTVRTGKEVLKPADVLSANQRVAAMAENTDRKMLMRIDASVDQTYTLLQRLSEQISEILNKLNVRQQVTNAAISKQLTTVDDKVKQLGHDLSDFKQTFVMQNTMAAAATFQANVFGLQQNVHNAASAFSQQPVSLSSSNSDGRKRRRSSVIYADPDESVDDLSKTSSAVVASSSSSPDTLSRESSEGQKEDDVAAAVAPNVEEEQVVGRSAKKARTVVQSDEAKNDVQPSAKASTRGKGRTGRGGKGRGKGRGGK